VLIAFYNIVFGKSQLDRIPFDKSYFAGNYFALFSKASINLSVKISETEQKKLESYIKSTLPLKNLSFHEY